MINKKLHPGKKKGSFYLFCPDPEMATLGRWMNQRICQDCDYCSKYDQGIKTICAYPKKIPEEERDITHHYKFKNGVCKIDEPLSESKN